MTKPICDTRPISDNGTGGIRPWWKGAVIYQI